MVKTGFVVIAAAILAWAWLSIGRAAVACGETPGAAERLRRRFLVTALAWVGIVLVVAESGVLRRWELRPPPMMFLFVAIATLGVVIARSRAGTFLARGLPLSSLVGLQAFRLPLELVMHRASTEGVMPAHMSYSGWNFDVLTGLTAAVLAVWLHVGSPPRGLVRAWNIGGARAAGQHRDDCPAVDARVRRVRDLAGPAQHLRDTAALYPAADGDGAGRLGGTPRHLQGARRGKPGRAQPSTSISAGSSMKSLILTRNCTASRPSTRRWS